MKPLTDYMLRIAVRKFCQRQSRKGRWATAPHILAPKIAKQFGLQLAYAAKLVKQWHIYEL